MKQEAITASAPGKIILFGEHFVVKGTRSIASAITRRVYVTIVPRNDDVIRIESPEANVYENIPLTKLQSKSEVLAPLTGMLKYIRDKYTVKLKPATIKVKSELPIGAGLGSSAAFSAAFALAYFNYIDLNYNKSLIHEISMIGEKIAHGNPSGIDTTMAVYGGSIVYKRGQEPVRVDLKLPSDYMLIIANTGVERSTREVVEHVLNRASRTWSASSKIYEAADSLIDLAIEAFNKGNMKLLGELMDLNQGLLYAVGASSEVIERILWTARYYGGLGAKLTGAGWGGSVIVLVSRKNSEKVMRGLLSTGARDVFGVTLGAPGVRLEV